MGGGEAGRDPEEKRQDAEADLDHRHPRQEIERRALRRSQRLAPGDGPEGEDRQRQQRREPAMQELYCRRRRKEGDGVTDEPNFGRDPGVAHQRKGVVDKAGIEAGNQRARENDDEGKGDEPGRCAAEPARRRQTRHRAKPLRQREQEAKDEDGEAEMSGETEMADVGIVDEAGGDHPPADRALERT